MLNILLPKDLANIRNNFASHPLFVAIQDACGECCSVPKSCKIRPEHVFVEVVTLLDELKENQEAADWSDLHFRITQDYNYINPDISDDELDCIASIVCTTLAAILVMSIPRVYHNRAELLLQQSFAHDIEVPRDKLYALCDMMEAHDGQLKPWIEEYMNSDELTSEVFESLFADSEDKTPQHIKIVPGVSGALRVEFKNALRHAIDAESNYGKAKKVKGILSYYSNEDVIELIGDEIDIYNDLHDYFGYNQSDKTFYAADPKLP